jgi:hypothetical protein
MLEKCDKAVESCKSALDARKEEIKLCRLGLMQSLERNSDLESQVSDQNQKLQSPFRNPFIMTTVGVVLGILVIGIAK